MNAQSPQKKKKLKEKIILDFEDREEKAKFLGFVGIGKKKFLGLWFRDSHD
jgi:hypothetical protein